MNIATIIERQNTALAKCNAQWVPGGRADDDDVNTMVCAASDLEMAVPTTIEEWFSKWRNLAGYRRKFEFDVSVDDISKMLIELSRVTGHCR